MPPDPPSARGLCMHKANAMPTLYYLTTRNFVATALSSDPFLFPILFYNIAKFGVFGIYCVMLLLSC